MNHQHGYLMVGDMEKAETAALKMIGRKLKKETNLLKSHPDFYFLKTPSLSINDAREIRDMASKKSFFGRGRVFVVKANFFTKEAMNALLKTLEEPAGKNCFFLITPSVENILETLKSRLVVLNFEKSQKLPEAKRKFIEKFLTVTISERFGLFSSFEDDKNKISNFFDGLEIVLRERLISDFSRKDVDFLEDLMKQRSFLARRGSSPKKIFEHLSGVL